MWSAQPAQRMLRYTLTPVILMFGSILQMFGQTDQSQLKEAIQSGAFLVDVRTPAEFAMGHVKGSVNIPLDQVANQLSKFKGKEHIVVFCQSGNRSGRAQAILEQNGIANVINGGGWSSVNRLVLELKP